MRNLPLKCALQFLTKQIKHFKTFQLPFSFLQYTAFIRGYKSISGNLIREVVQLWHEGVEFSQHSCHKHTKDWLHDCMFKTDSTPPRRWLMLKVWPAKTQALESSMQRCSTHVSLGPDYTNVSKYSRYISLGHYNKMGSQADLKSDLNISAHLL